MRALCHAKLLQMQVIIEDSEMLAYGCPRFLFKMDKDCVCMNQAHPCRVLASAHKTPRHANIAAPQGFWIPRSF